MQVVSNGDNLHEMSNPVYSEQIRKILQNVCWNFYPECQALVFNFVN